MHKPEYKYGKCQTLFDIKEKVQMKNWEMPGNVKKAYDKSLKGYVCIMEENSKMSTPRNPRS